MNSTNIMALIIIITLLFTNCFADFHYRKEIKKLEEEKNVLQKELKIEREAVLAYKTKSELIDQKMSQKIVKIKEVLKYDEKSKDWGSTLIPDAIVIELHNSTNRN